MFSMCTYQVFIQKNFAGRKFTIHIANQYLVQHVKLAMKKVQHGKEMFKGIGIAPTKLLILE